MSLHSPHPGKVIFHAINLDLSVCIEEEYISNLYLYLSEDNTPEKEGTTYVLIYRNK